MLQVARRIAAAVMAVGVLAGCGTQAAPPSFRGGIQAPAGASAEPQVARSAPGGVTRITYPARGSRRWVSAPAQTGPAAGRSGTLLRYRVLVERDIAGLRAGTFATAVAAIFAADDGWTAGGTWRFQRVGAGQPYDFTLYLVTPDTRDVLCADVPDGYTSCRNGDRVVLNVARWVKGVPAYRGDLDGYRTYMVNHEVGHRLGHGHERCPGAGEPAPVMLQQTLGLHGCEPNDVPYPGGQRYAGPPGQYPDEAPRRDAGRS